jgi:APA family basic amino acid/polyamine antiporter
LAPEALTTIATEPWSEIARVARAHRCESLLLGLSNVEQDGSGAPIGKLLSKIESDAVILRAPEGWTPDSAKRILVPMAGHGHHDRLLVRLLSSLSRTSAQTITVLKVFSPGISPARLAIAERGLRKRARDLRVGGSIEAKVAIHSDPIQAIVQEATDHDLIILGTERSRKNRAFGPFALAVARETASPMLLISHAT